MSCLLQVRCWCSSLWGPSGVADGHAQPERCWFGVWSVFAQGGVRKRERESVCLLVLPTWLVLIPRQPSNCIRFSSCSNIVLTVDCCWCVVCLANCFFIVFLFCPSLLLLFMCRQKFQIRADRWTPRVGKPHTCELMSKACCAPVLKLSSVQVRWLGSLTNFQSHNMTCMDDISEEIHVQNVLFERSTGRWIWCTGLK